jgi:hypothetical protein
MPNSYICTYTHTYTTHTYTHVYIHTTPSPPPPSHTHYTPQFLAHTVEYAKFCVLMRDGDVTVAADTVRALLKVRLRHYILSL